MKNLIIIVSSVLLLASTACKKAREFTYFNVNQSTEFTIPAATKVLPLPGDLATTPVKTSSEFDFSTDKKKSKYIDEVVTKSIKLSIISPESQNFNFLNSVKIYINAPGQSEALIAFKDKVPENVKEFDLDMTGTRVDPYLKSESYTLRVEAVTDEINSQEIKIKTDMVFRVRANVL